MSKNIKIAVSGLVAISVVAPFVAYFIAKHSEPYRYFEKRVHNSLVIKEMVGEVESIKLAPFGYSVRYNGAQGWAQFETRVVGPQATGTLFVSLESKLGAWQVTGARFNGMEIKLTD
jgi:hypothetical protein